MAQPTSRSEFINYCKRQLGAPVLEINVADEQIEDLVDDAIQYFHERHFDGVIQTFLHYKITEDDINRGKGPGTAGVSGITTTTVTHSVGSNDHLFHLQRTITIFKFHQQLLV